MAIVFLIGCANKDSELTNTPTEKEDVVAILLGNEITKKDILTQYPLEDRYIEVYLKEEIMMLEAKKQEIVVLQGAVDYLLKMLYPGLHTEGDTQFFEEQAELLGMTPEEYYDMWSYKYVIRDSYLQHYIEKNFDEPTTEEEAKIWHQTIDQHFADLVEQYKQNGDLVMIKDKTSN